MVGHVFLLGVVLSDLAEGRFRHSFVSFVEVLLA